MILYLWVVSTPYSIEHNLENLISPRIWDFTVDFQYSSYWNQSGRSKIFLERPGISQSEGGIYNSVEATLLPITLYTSGELGPVRKIFIVVRKRYNVCSRLNNYLDNFIAWSDQAWSIRTPPLNWTITMMHSIRIVNLYIVYQEHLVARLAHKMLHWCYYVQQCWYLVSKYGHILYEHRPWKVSCVVQSRDRDYVEYSFVEVIQCSKN